MVSGLYRRNVAIIIWQINVRLNVTFSSCFSPEPTFAPVEYAQIRILINMVHNVALEPPDAHRRIVVDGAASP